MSAHRREGISDAAVLVAIGSRRRRWRLRVAVGRGRRRAVRPGWPHVGRGQLLGVLVRLPAQLGDPAAPGRASPARAAGAGGFYAALALLAGARRRRRADRRARVAAGRRTAGAPAGRVAASCGALAAPASEPGAGWRSVLRGRAAARRAPARAGRVRAAAVGQVGRAGDPGAARMAGPGGRLLDQDGPARGDARAPAGARARCSCSTRSGSPASRGHTWSPLRGARAGTERSRSPGGWPRPASSTSAASRAATSGRSPPSSDWRRCCTPRQRPARGIEQRGRWAYGQGTRELESALADQRPSACDEQEQLDARAAYDAVRAFEAQADRTRTSIEATAQALLRAYRFTRVPARRTAARSPPSGCSTRNATLYLIGDAKASKLLRPIFLALLSRGRRPRLRARDARRRATRAAAAALPRRGRKRRAAAQPGRDRLDGAEPQHPADLDLPRPRAGPQPLRPAGGDRRQQPPRADAAAGGRRPRDAALLLRTGRRGGGARADAHERARRDARAPPRAGAGR